MAPQKLFTPLVLGGKKNPIQLQHRVVMAPLTRLKGGDEGVLPELAVTYYEQRSTAGGLIISEATNITPYARGYLGAPGIFNQAQIDAWKSITEAVHKKKGVIFMQLWHTGRTSHPLLQPGGVLPVSSSTNLPLSEKRVVPTSEGMKPQVTPRALETDEIPELCEQYRQAAENAIEAGFDGVELHCANGYLLEQFIFDGINDRTDKYGGSIENRARIVFEILDSILKSLDSSKVGVRFSPFNLPAAQPDSDPIATYTYILEKLNEYDLAYVHLIEPRSFHYPNDRAPKEGVNAYFRKVYKGVLMAASGFDRDSSIKIVEDDDADMVAIGRYFISNPDLVKRFELDAPLNTYDKQTFYDWVVHEPLGPSKGYTDYPFMEDSKLE